MKAQIFCLPFRCWIWFQLRFYACFLKTFSLHRGFEIRGFNKSWKFWSRNREFSNEHVCLQIALFSRFDLQMKILRLYKRANNGLGGSSRLGAHNVNIGNCTRESRPAWSMINDHVPIIFWFSLIPRIAIKSGQASKMARKRGPPKVRRSADNCPKVDSTIQRYAIHYYKFRKLMRFLNYRTKRLAVKSTRATSSPVFTM